MNKLGFYLQVSRDQDGLFGAMERVRPPVVLLHTDGLNRDFLDFNRERSTWPNAFVIGRLFKDNPDQDRMLDQGDPAANGRAYAQEILDYDFGLAKRRTPNGRLLIDAWMTLNESIPGPASQPFREEPNKFIQRMRNYDTFQVAFRERLQEEGLEAVAFNFAAGNFSEPEHYLDYFPGTLETYRYLGFHEYGWHHHDPAHIHPTRGQAKSGAGLYRRCMAGIRQKYGDRHTVIMTELGLTREYKHSHQDRDPRDDHLRDLGWLCYTETLGEEEYFDSLRWYNDFMLEDDYVMGGCLYNVGHTHKFLSHRHLGTDNDGQPITILDRVAGLNG